MTEAMPPADPEPPVGDASALAPVDDPTVETLLPARSTGRNVALLVAGVAVLAGAWWSSDVLRPSLVEDSSAGVAGPSGDLFVTVSEVRAQGWPWVEVVDVPGVPGATPAEVHLAPGLLTDGGDLEQVTRLGPGDRGTGTHGRLAHGQVGTMTILWEVTDCQALASSFGAGTTVITRSGLGFGNEETLPVWASPDWLAGEESESGVC